jgi:hypothetical protein
VYAIHIQNYTIIKWTEPFHESNKSPRLLCLSLLSSGVTVQGRTKKKTYWPFEYVVRLVSWNVCASTKKRWKLFFGQKNWQCGKWSLYVWKRMACNCQFYHQLWAHIQEYTHTFRAQTSLCWRPCPEAEVNEIEQWSYVKIEFSPPEIARACLALGDRALPYRRVAR